MRGLLIEIGAIKGEVETLLLDGSMIIDTRSNTEFAQGHIRGTINIPYDRSFTNWAGWIVNYDRPLYLLLDKEQAAEVLHDLYSVGIDNVAGFIDLSVLGVYKADGELSTYENKMPTDIAFMVEQGEFHVLDVRNLSEYEEGHIPGAQHIMLGTLSDRIQEIPKDKPILVHCKGGGRSAIGMSILLAHSIHNVTNLVGGYQQWSVQGFPIQR